MQGQLRPLLAPRVYTLPMVRSIGKTMVQGKNYGPQITVKRISTRSVPASCGGPQRGALWFYSFVKYLASELSKKQTLFVLHGIGKLDVFYVFQILETGLC